MLCAWNSLSIAIGSMPGVPHNDTEGEDDDQAYPANSLQP